MSISRILVGVDHSERSDKAVKRANALALLHDAKLTLGYALDISPQSGMRELLQKVAVDETRARVGTLIDEAGEAIEVLTGVGRAHEVMRTLAQNGRSDLVVLGIHRPEPALAGLVGHTARRLIDAAPAPVLVVKDEPVHGYERVLVGYDDSEASRQALRFVHALAPQAKITVVTACMIPFSSRHESAALTEQFEADARRMANEALAAQGVAVADVIARAGEAFSVLLNTVDELKPDLLVLGTSMPAYYRRVFGGGIVDLIASDPPCDLLVVKT